MFNIYEVSAVGENIYDIVYSMEDKVYEVQLYCYFYPMPGNDYVKDDGNSISVVYV